MTGSVFFYTKGFKRWLRVHIHTPFFCAWGYGIVMDCVFVSSYRLVECVLSANFKRNVGPVKLIMGGLEYHIIYEISLKDKELGWGPKRCTSRVGVI